MRSYKGMHVLGDSLMGRLHAYTGVSMCISQASLYPYIRLKVIVFSALRCPDEAFA